MSAYIGHTLRVLEAVPYTPGEPHEHLMANTALDSFIAAAKRYPLLTPSQEIELARVYQRGLKPDSTPREQRQSKRAREKIINCNLRMVVSIASKFRSRILGTALDVEDLCQEGVTGLARAAEKFDCEKGYKFSTYSYWWVQQSITRAIELQRTTIRLSGTALTVSRKWKYRPDNQSLADFCAEHGYKEAWALQYIEDVRRAETSSLDRVARDLGEGGSSIVDLLTDGAPNGLEALAYADALDDVRDAVDPDDLALLELQASGASKTDLAALVGVAPTVVTKHLREAQHRVRQSCPSVVQMIAEPKVERKPKPTLIPTLPRPVLTVVPQPSPVRIIQSANTQPLPMSTTNGHREVDTEALERLVADVQAEPAVEAPKRRRGRPAGSSARATAKPAPAAPAGTIRMVVGDVAVEASVADAAQLLKHLNAA